MSKRPRGNRVEDKMIDALDDLAEFEQFRDELLPELRKALSEKVSADELYKRYEAHAAARTISIAMKSPEASVALAAAKDIRDRATGKAKERLDVRHKYANLKDEELDSLLLSQDDEMPEGPDSDSVDRDPSDLN